MDTPRLDFEIGDRVKLTDDFKLGREGTITGFQSYPTGVWVTVQWLDRTRPLRRSAAGRGD